MEYQFINLKSSISTLMKVLLFILNSLFNYNLASEKILSNSFYMPILQKNH